jgi:hypothetical protein
MPVRGLGWRVADRARRIRVPLAACFTCYGLRRACEAAEEFGQAGAVGGSLGEAAADDVTERSGQRCQVRLALGLAAGAAGGGAFPVAAKQSTAPSGNTSTAAVTIRLPCCSDCLPRWLMAARLSGSPLPRKPQ